MKANIKNIIIGVVAVAVLAGGYFMFIKKAPAEAPLTSSSGIATSEASTATVSPEIGKDFVTFLLSVKSIKLDDSIFSDPAFLSLKDSSILILLIDSGVMGRPNPFAPIGTDTSSAASSVNLSADNSVQEPAINIGGSSTSTQINVSTSNTSSTANTNNTTSATKNGTTTKTGA